MRRYLVSHHGEQIAEFVEVESGKRSNRPQLTAGQEAHKVTLLVANLDRSHHCQHARANRLTLHVLAAAAEHERHMIGERARQALAAAKARGFKLGNPKQAEINRAKATEQAQASRPHIERCIKTGRTSSSAIAADLNVRGIAALNGGRWFPMQVSRARRRLGLTAPATRSPLDPGGSFFGRGLFATGPGVVTLFGLGCLVGAGRRSNAWRLDH